jgi:uncharacterized membrane protein YgcG
MKTKLLMATAAFAIAAYAAPMQAETLNTAQASHFSAKIHLAQATKPETKGSEEQGNPGKGKSGQGGMKSGMKSGGTMSKSGGDSSKTETGMKKDPRNGEKQGEQGHTK